MRAPCGRIVVLHMATIAGGFAVMVFGSPAGLLLALVLIKIAPDRWPHRRAHRRPDTEEEPA